MKKTICVLLVFLLFISVNLFSESLYSEPTQNPNVRYRLFPTPVPFDTLKLDTVTGQIWQIHYDDVNDRNNTYVAVLNDKNLAAGKDISLGRFTLYTSSSALVYILIDQKDGDIWKLEWSIEDLKWHMSSI